MLDQPQEETHHGWRIVSSGDIVVGVDQSPEARWAVLWAAREARLRGATLALAHVRSSVSDHRAAGDAESEAETLLIVRAAEASELEPEISVAPRLYESGSISEQLIELSGTAALLVLGVASARPRAEHGLLGPVEDRVVVHQAPQANMLASAHDEQACIFGPVEGRAGDFAGRFTNHDCSGPH